MEHREKITSIVAALLPWYAENARDLPWRRTKDPYLIAVSEIMLQQTQVKTVIPFFERWQRELPTIQAAANASPDRLHKLWEGLGYYSRVRNLQKAAQIIVARHGGMFPEAFDEVLALPGIGRYTAGAICSIAFNQPVPILDGNVMRVLTRVFGIAGNPREKAVNERLWGLAGELVRQAVHAGRARSRAPQTPGRAPASCSRLNQSLMELGALVCTPRQPQCAVCPVKNSCMARRENRVAELPNLGPRVPVTRRHFVAFVIERDGRYLVRQRPAGVVNAHLWEFPNVETSGAPVRPEEILASEFGLAAGVIAPLVTIKHSITRYRMTVSAFKVVSAAGGVRRPLVWKSPGQLEGLALTSAHRKILKGAGKKPEA